MKQKNNSLLFKIGKLHAVPKLLFCIASAVLAYFIIPTYAAVHFMISWDVFSFMMITLSLVSFFTFDTKAMRVRSQEQDESAFIIFIIIVIATLASLAEVLFLLTGKATNSQLIIAILGLCFSWLLIHIIFAFRYAHLYYMNDQEDANVHAGGLDFPADKRPDYLDFAYFSFVLGMTFQVSDIQITSKRFRRLALLHGLISFVFNTLIIALTINVVAGLRK